MNKTCMSNLLGRPLTSTEDSNFNQYLKIARGRLDDLLCTSTEPSTEARTYDVREGYSTVFTDIFTEVQSVSVRGSVLTSAQYTPYQWNNRRGEWFNSIVLKDVYAEDVTITADWGFDELPDDLELLLAKAFAQVSNRRDGSVKSKKIEDFSVTYSDATAAEQFRLDNLATINKYSLCGIPELQSGRVCRV